jgi:F-type H+-transporting ATPase subunit epsilon
MIHLQVITLGGVFIDKEVFEVRIPTMAGPIVVNGGHAPLVGSIKPGILTVVHQKGDRDEQFEQIGVYEGTLEVLHNVLHIMVDEVDTPEDLSEAEAEKAFNRAKELTEKAGDAVALSEAHSMMDRSAVRLQLASLKKHRSKR